MGKKLDLITPSELAKMLGVSPPTLRKMMKETRLGKLAVPIGKRVKFPRREIEKLYFEGTSDETTDWIIPESQLEIVSTKGIKIKEGLIDLRGIQYIDPYGSLSLLAYLIQKHREGEKIGLVIDDSDMCKKLKYIGFFDHIDKYAKNVSYDRAKLTGHYLCPESILPITLIKRKGEEKICLEQLKSLYVQQEFSANIGGYISWVLGELSDNSLTHGGSTFEEKMCFIQAQRYTLGENNKCIVVGIADIGIGIGNSLKKNPQYSGLDDLTALLTAFKSGVSSWDYDRGNGLADIMSIAMGNGSVMRVSSGGFDLKFDFQHEWEIEKITPPLFQTRGTTLGFIYIDHDFDKSPRKDVDRFITKATKAL